MTISGNRCKFAILYSAGAAGYWIIAVLFLRSIEYGVVFFVPYIWLWDLLIETKWPIDRFGKLNEEKSKQMRLLDTMVKTFAGIAMLVGGAAIASEHGRRLNPVAVGAAAMLVAIATWWSLRWHRSGTGRAGATRPSA